MDIKNALRKVHQGFVDELDYCKLFRVYIKNVFSRI